MCVRKRGTTSLRCAQLPTVCLTQLLHGAFSPRTSSNLLCPSPSALGAEQHVERRGEGLRGDHQLRVRHNHPIFQRFPIYNPSSL